MIKYFFWITCCICIFHNSFEHCRKKVSIYWLLIYWHFSLFLFRFVKACSRGAWGPEVDDIFCVFSVLKLVIVGFVLYNILCDAKAHTCWVRRMHGREEKRTSEGWISFEHMYLFVKTRKNIYSWPCLGTAEKIFQFAGIKVLWQFFNAGYRMDYSLLMFIEDNY